MIWSWTLPCRSFFYLLCFYFCCYYRSYLTASDLSVQLSFSSWFNVGGLYISRTLSISSKFGKFVCIELFSLSLFNFYSISNYSSLSFLILFGSSLFLSWWTYPEMCQLYLPSQRTSYCVCWFFFYLVLNLYLFPICYLLVISYYWF